MANRETTDKEDDKGEIGTPDDSEDDEYGEYDDENQVEDVSLLYKKLL